MINNKTPQITSLMLNTLNPLIENSEKRYKGSKFADLTRSINKNGVLSPIQVGCLNKEYHIFMEQQLEVMLY